MSVPVRSWPSRSYTIVYERAGEELAVAIVHDRLEQRLAEALREGAVELALREERVDHRPRVVHPHEPLDDRPSGLGLDRERADDAAEAPHLALGLEIGAGLEPRRVARRQRLAARVGRGRDLAPGHASLGHADDLEPAGHPDHVGVRRLEELRGDAPTLLAHVPCD